MILNIDKISKTYGERTLFADASLRIEARQRYALVGPNGAGKTTMMNIIAGLESPDSGTVTFSKGIRVGYLEQESIEMDGKSVLAEVMASVADVSQMGKRLEEIEKELEQADDASSGALLEEYGKLRNRYEARDGYNIESKAHRVLFGLGFHEQDLTRSTDEFSGGWQMRISLAKLLLRQPDLLLLDEPTNHLDLESVRWLENFLRSYSAAVLVVSHDRAFMNAMVDHVAEIANGKLDLYVGNYDAFLKQRKERREQLIAMKEAQDKEIAHMNVFIEKFRYKASKAKQVQDRVKKLEKIQRIVIPDEKKPVHFKFPQPKRTGDCVMHLENVSKSYGRKLVYNDLNLDIWRGEKVALVGPNGSGKSTLLKMIAGQEKPTSGHLVNGTHVHVSYFAQHQLEELNLKNTVFAELDSAAPAWTRTQVQSLLGAFLFNGDDVEKRVSVLSGGEKARLALAKMLVSPTPLLCLDEPTNHLDISSVDVLEQALKSFKGTFVIISHDEHLIRKIATRILYIKDGVMTDYQGDYDYFLYKSGQTDINGNPTMSAEEANRKLSKRDSSLNDAGQHGASGGGGVAGGRGAGSGGAGSTGAAGVNVGEHPGSGRNGAGEHPGSVDAAFEAGAAEAGGAAESAGAATNTGEPSLKSTGETVRTPFELSANLGAATKGSAPKSKEQKRAEAQKRNAIYRKLKNERARLAELEERMPKDEARYNELVELMADETLYADKDKFNAALAEFNEIKVRMQADEEEWLKISTQIEDELKNAGIAT